MRIRYLILLALFSFSNLHHLRSQTMMEKEPLGFGLDVYGIFLPVVIYDLLIMEHLHASVSLPYLEGFGLAYSKWGGQTYYRNEYSGVGIQYRRDFKKSFIKFETGMLLTYHKPRDFDIIGLRPGSRAPYVRAHMGWPMGPRFYTGFVINWVPRSKHIIYISSFSGSPPRDFNQRRNPPSQHKSLSFFVGFCLK